MFARQLSYEQDGRAAPLHIPLRLPGRLSELDRDRPVAFLCRSGTRSSQAARLATKAGYEALNVRGGLHAWSRANLPLTR